MPYIYKITNKVNGKVYIGKTMETIEKRWKEHLKDSKRERCEKRPLYNAINKYGEENFTIEQVEECAYDILNEREKYWINYYNTYQDGYNATLGGDGRILYDYEWVYKKWLEHGKNCSEVHRIYDIDVGTVSRAVRAYGERPYCIAPNPVRKKVKMLSIDGVFIKSFDSIREAAEYIVLENGKSLKNVGGYASHISAVCMGKRKTCLGYKWEYEKI